MTELTVHTEDKVTVPTGERMMVSTGDWSRIRQNTEKMGEPPAEYATTGAVALAGAAVTLLGVVIGLEHATPAASSNLLTGLWVAFALCSAFAVVLFLIGRRDRARYRVSNGTICNDMDDVAERCGHPDLGAVPPKRRTGIKPWFKRLWEGDSPNDDGT
jgi:hypothetical protein